MNQTPLPICRLLPLFKQSLNMCFLTYRATTMRWKFPPTLTTVLLRWRLAIPPAAEPAWNAAKCHWGAEQMAKLWADHIDHLLENDIIPAAYLGSERLPRYFLQQDNLPTPMLDLILKHGREKALLASQLLCQQQVREKGYADFYIRSMADLFKQGDQVEKKHRSTRPPRLPGLSFPHR